MRIGIFGGSFNPPHQMHESIIKQLLDRNYLDHVILVPTSNYYPKAGLISDEQRFKMLELMSENDKRISLSKYEFGRLTYTYQTLEYFQKEHPNDEIYFICGSDNLSEMDTWLEYEKILGDYEVIVIPRNHDMQQLLDKYDQYRNNIKVVELENNYLSSTKVREYLKDKNYDAVKEYIDAEVLQYIQANHLYEK